MITLYNTFSNVFSKKIMRERTDFFLFNALISTIAFVTFMFLAINAKCFSFYTVIMGALFAFITIISQFTGIQAMRFGSMANTVMFKSCGMLIPAIAGILFWHEEVSYLQIVGVTIIVISFIIGADLKEKNKMTLKWFFYAVLVFISAGMTGVVQKIHQGSSHRDERFALLFIAFFIMGISSWIMFFISGKRNNNTYSIRITPKFFILFAATGVCFSFMHAANLYLSGTLPGIFFFPIVNGVPTVLCGLVSVLIMKEKLNRAQVISLIIGTIGIIILGIS